MGQSIFDFVSLFFFSSVSKPFALHTESSDAKIFEIGPLESKLLGHKSVQNYKNYCLLCGSGCNI